MNIKANLSENALRVLKERYLTKNEKGEVIETPEQMFRRVADNIADSKELADKIYKLMCETRFLPNSPAFNAGTPIKSYSACFSLTVGDSMEEIFDTLKNCALIAKSGGGLGLNFNKIRPKGSAVRSTSGISSGAVSFASVFNSAIDVIKQGGCVGQSSYIRTDKGLKTIGSFLNCPPFGDNYINTGVYTLNGFNTAWLSQDNGIAEVVKIETEHGYSIEATYNEQIEVVDEKGNFAWKQISEIKEGDWIKIVKGGHKGIDIPIKKTTIGYHFNDLKTLKIPEYVTEGIGEILGMYMSNGCINISTGYINFTIADKYPEALSCLCKNMESEFGIKGRVRKHREKDGKCKQIDFSSKRLIQVFQEMNWIKQRSPNAFIPSSILESKENICYAFLRGLYECDGYIHKDGFPIYSTTSCVLADQLQHLLLALGIVSYKSHSACGHSSNELYTISITQSASVRKFIENIGFISKEKNSKLKAYNKNFDDIIPNQQKHITESYKKYIIETNKEKNIRPLYRKIEHYLEGHVGIRQLTRYYLINLMSEYPQLFNGHFHEIVNDNLFFTKISNISTDKVQTMEIEVSNTNSYVANGFHIKNKRRGALLGSLAIDHPEVIDWINCKDVGSTLSNFNLSVAITDDFIDAVKNNKMWNLEWKGKVLKTLPAKELFDIICQHSWRTGEPGLLFFDEINRHNCHKHIGPIENVNPCSEVNIFVGKCPIDYPELGIEAGDDIAESCNLGSFDVSKYVKNNKMDWESLANDIPTAVDFLDCIPDKNEYIMPEIEKGTKLLRKIGLGLMGFADALVLLRIRYNSQEALSFGEYLMEFISYHSTKASVELAKKKGSFPAFKGSAWDTGEVWSFTNTTDKFDWESIKESIIKYGIRNCSITSLPPTGTVSIIAGCSSAIEPIFGVVFEKHISMGTLYETNRYFKQMMEDHGIWNEEIIKKCSERASIQHIQEIPNDIKILFQTSHDVPYDQHLRMQIAFQKYTHQSISKTINMQNSVIVNDIAKAFMMAMDGGCKGITIYRDGSRNEQVLVTGKPTEPIPTPRPRFKDHLAIIREVKSGCGVFYNAFSVDQWGIFEDFLNTSGKGGCVASQAANGRLISGMLRYNVPIEIAIKQLHRVKCDSCITKKANGDSDITILSCADGVSKHLKDYTDNKEILKKMIELQSLIHKSFNSNGKTNDNLSIDALLTQQKEEPRKCPECGSTTLEQNKCGTCLNCGFSKCL